MKKIILTGFMPFGRYSHNPTQRSTEYFNGKVIADRKVIGMVLPCTYYGAYCNLRNMIIQEEPYAIISTGLSSIVPGMQIEARFKNIMNGKYADTDGYDPKDLPIREDSPISLPVMNCDPVVILGLFRNNDIPSRFSLNAETFICNALGYQTSNYILNNELKTKNIFIHVPWTTAYKNDVTLEKGKIFLEEHLFYRGLELLIENI